MNVGTVTRVGDGPAAWVQLDSTPGYSVGPCEVAAPARPVALGDRVAVGELGGGDYLVVARIGEPAGVEPLAVSTMWFDFERDEDGLDGDPWLWQTPGWADPSLCVVPVTHFAHHGPHELGFAAGGLDGNDPAFMYTEYVPPDYDNDRGLYHVDGLLMLSTFLGGSAPAAPVKVFWNIGVFPTGDLDPELDYGNWGIEDTLNLPGDGDVITSRVSYDMIFDGDRDWANVTSPWMRCTNAPTRAKLQVMKCIVTARRLGPWPALPA